MSATINGSYIDGPAAPGVSAPMLITLDNTGDTTGTLSATATLYATAGNGYDERADVC